MIDNNTFELFVRLVLALILGAIIGVERILAHKSAGIRTHALVSMGAALFVIISEETISKYITAGVIGVQPTYVLAQIVVAIGFLSGGLFLKHDDHVTGLTTASGLWIVAAIGSSIGFGYYALGAMTTLLTLFIFIALWIVEDKLQPYSKPKRAKK
jgi:putative Mg2+ transporter-C (MgtC) family protein